MSSTYEIRIAPCDPTRTRAVLIDSRDPDRLVFLTNLRPTAEYVRFSPELWIKARSPRARGEIKEVPAEKAAELESLFARVSAEGDRLTLGCVSEVSVSLESKRKEAKMKIDGEAAANIDRVKALRGVERREIPRLLRELADRVQTAIGASGAVVQVSPASIELEYSGQSPERVQAVSVSASLGGRSVSFSLDGSERVGGGRRIDVRVQGGREFLPKAHLMTAEAKDDPSAAVIAVPSADNRRLARLTDEDVERIILAALLP